MRTAKLSKTGYNKLTNGELSLYEKDFENLSKSFFPGEWISVENIPGVFGFINPLVIKGPIFRVVGKKSNTNFDKEIEEDFSKKILVKNIDRALARRAMFNNLKDGSRLIYGDEDSLPGLIVDQYQNEIILQINTAGIDRYRTFVAEYLANKLSREVTFLDNKSYRSNEVLPEYEKTNKSGVISISENNFLYEIDWSLMQKVGYYYDHRINREKLETVLMKYTGPKKTGLDLFSYIGSWGLHCLRAGVDHVDFVDQANMEEVTKRNLELNDLKDRGSFTRSDVFNFLEIVKNTDKKYDVIVCDPPAFAKDESGKKGALRGYERLYNLIFDITAQSSIVAAASCTHYVSMDELDKCVQNAAKKKGVELQVLDLGIQGFDHPMMSMTSKSNYIKYILYYVRNGDGQ